MFEIGKGGLEPPASRTMRPPLFHLSYIPLTRAFRVSKVFYVLCLNTRRFGLRQHRLYGRAPLRGLDFTVQLYAHKEVCRHALTAMVRVGNCVRFSTSRFCPNLFLLRTRTQERRSQWKNVYVKWRQPLTNLPYEYILPQTLQKVVVHVLAT